MMLWLLFVLAVAAALIAWGALPALAGADLAGSPSLSDLRWKDVASGIRRRVSRLVGRLRGLELPERVRDLVADEEEDDGAVDDGGFVFAPGRTQAPRTRFDTERALAAARLAAFVLGMAMVFAMGVGVAVLLIGRTISHLLVGG